MKTYPIQYFLLLVAAGLSLLLSGCGGNNTLSPTLTGLNSTVIVGISISPTTSTIVPLGTQQYTATVTGTGNTGVTWSIQSTGNNTLYTATISSSGLVTTGFNNNTSFSHNHQAPSGSAPANRPGNSSSFTVTATSNADPTKSATATLFVSGISAVQITISPTTANAFYGGNPIQFTGTVTGNANTAVRWTANFGTITQTGLYTPPLFSNSQSQETDTVTATSVADPSKSAVASVNVNNG